MSQFLKKIIAFIIPLLVLSVFADILISNGLKKSDYYAQGETFIWNEIYNGNIDEDIFIYGSSRAWVHIDPKIL